MQGYSLADVDGLFHLECHLLAHRVSWRSAATCPKLRLDRK